MEDPSCRLSMISVISAMFLRWNLLMDSPCGGILLCNINPAASWAGGQESARKPALVGGTSVAEVVVFAFGVLSSNKLVLCGTEFESWSWMPGA